MSAVPLGAAVAWAVVLSIREELGDFSGALGGERARFCRRDEAPPGERAIQSRLVP